MSDEDIQLITIIIEGAEHSGGCGQEDREAYLLRWGEATNKYTDKNVKYDEYHKVNDRS